MNALFKAATIAAAVALSSQPCLAAAVDGPSSSLATMAATERVDFNLKTHASLDTGQNRAGALALATAAASSQEAAAGQELEEPKRRGMSKGTQTALIAGGAVLVGVIVLGIVASNQMKKGWDWGSSTP